MSLEYLGTEPPPRRRWVWPAIGLFAVLVAGVGWWTQHVRDEADETFATVVAQVQDDARAGQAKVLSTLTYASPMIWSMEVSEKVRADLRKVVQGSASDVVTGLRRVREDVANTRVLPWQGDQVADRKAVLGLVDAYLGRFEEIAADARSIGSVMARPEPEVPSITSASTGSTAPGH